MKRLLTGLMTLTCGTTIWAQSPAITCEQPCKTCVREVKTGNTKKVYSVKCEDYCLPYCSLFALFHGKCNCSCGELRVRHRLVVKKVPTCDTAQCVPKETKPQIICPAAASERQAQQPPVSWSPVEHTQPAVPKQ